jgi:plastocyanin
MAGRRAVWAVIVLLFASFAVAGPAIMVRDATRASADGEVAAEGDGAAQVDEPLVVMANIAFQPATLRVASGTTVVWSNQDVTPHTVTTDAADSGLIDPGGSFSTTVTAPVDYICTLHSNMAGTVQVD